MSPETGGTVGRIHGLTTAQWRSTIKTMRCLQAPMSIRGELMGLHMVLLAAILSVSWSGVVCQLHALIDRTSEPVSVTSSQYVMGEHAHGAHLRLASSCPEHHEHRLTTQQRQPFVAKSRLAAMPSQASTELPRMVRQADSASLTFAGPSPPFLGDFPSRAPPLPRSRV